ncbi:MAG TPA: glycosyltransferase family 39 protein [Bryobacteraceae bacterium]|nr:glycosyltransferase family 39 protein [Bryobacteraceae bacterium]
MTTVESTTDPTCKISVPNFKRNVELVLLVSGVALTRIAFRSRVLYDLDSVNFALAMRHFDPTIHQPHPPGYFLYICLARITNLIFRNDNNALVAISVAASCGAAAMIYVLARRWFGSRAAVFAGLIFLFSPLAWFHGTVALTYIVEAFLSALLGFFCWRAYCGERRFVLAAALVAGIGAGIRPSSLLFLSPLFLFSLSTLSWKRRLKAVCAFAAAVLCWFVPMIYASGGLSAYVSSLSALWWRVAARETVVNSPLTTSMVRLCGIVAIYVFCFGSITLIMPRAFHVKAHAPERAKLFTYVWIAPALLFFTFVFLKLINSGYLLVIFPPACIWLGYWASDWYTEGRWPKPVKMGVAVILCVLNVVMFLEAPEYWSYRSVRRFETELAAVRSATRQLASPETTLLVGFDSHFFGYRHAGYYLPEYTIVQFPALSFREGKRVFAMHDRDTRLLARLNVNQYKNFMLFPLPSDEQQYDYLQKQVQLHSPSARLTISHLRHHTFISGPIEDLRFLFPDEVPPVAPVYTTHHSLTAPVNIR